MADKVYVAKEATLITLKNKISNLASNGAFTDIESLLSKGIGVDPTDCELIKGTSSSTSGITIKGNGVIALNTSEAAYNLTIDGTAVYNTSTTFTGYYGQLWVDFSESIKVAVTSSGKSFAYIAYIYS